MLCRYIAHMTRSKVNRKNIYDSMDIEAINPIPDLTLIFVIYGCGFFFNLLVTMGYFMQSYRQTHIDMKIGSK